MDNKKIYLVLSIVVGLVLISSIGYYFFVYKPDADAKALAAQQAAAAAQLAAQQAAAAAAAKSASSSSNSGILGGLLGLL